MTGLKAALEDRVGGERWRLASWVGSTLLAVLIAHQAVLPLAGRLAAARSALTALKENTYEAAWLDSTQANLRADTELLREFHAARRAALAPDSSVQYAVDRIRGLAQKSGIEVIKTTPALAKADSLSLLKVKVEGYARYQGLMEFFAALRASHPDLFLEELLIRQGGERAGGRLEASLVVHAYSARRDVGARLHRPIAPGAARTCRRDP
jgi:hypothetical protein